MDIDLLLEQLTSPLTLSVEGEGDIGGGTPGKAEEGHEETQEGGDALSADMDHAIEKKINAAMNNHLSRFRAAFEKDIKKSFGGMLDGAMNPLAEQLSGLSEKLTQQPPASEGEASGDGGRWQRKYHEQEKKYESRIQELESSLNEVARERENERLLRAKQEERTALQQALSSAGITGTRQRAAISLLYTEDKRVHRNEDGDIVFSIPKAGYTDEVTLDEGINEWLKSSEGREFLPPRGTSGSGASGSQASRPSRGPRNKQEAYQQARAKLAEAMGVITNTGE